MKNSPPEVLVISPQGGAEEATQDHIITQVVPRVPDGDVPEETMIHPKKVGLPGLHIPTQAHHAPSSSIQGLVAREKVR